MHAQVRNNKILEEGLALW